MEMTELIKKLNEATVAYEAGAPIMSDEEWDNLYFQLKQMEEESGVQLQSSPTHKILQSVSTLPKVKHSHLMLSCDKTKSLDDIVEFCNKTSSWCVATPKLDGLSCSLTYQYGKLIRAETRGNGEIGEDVTHNAQFIKNIPLSIGDTSEEFVVDGEVIVKVDDFEKYVDEYSNPRALAVGGLRLLMSKESKEIPLRFIAWKLIKSSLRQYSSYEDELRYLKELGFDRADFVATPFKTSDSISIEKIVNDIKHMASIKKQPIDGVVFRYENLTYGESLGATAHHRRDMLAYKFYDEEYETKLLDIDWTMSKTGVLTPVAVFEPVEIDGTKVERANLHNLDIINHLFVNNKPIKYQPIWVAKMNQIIPQVTRTALYSYEGEVLEPPKKCPVCGEDTKIIDSQLICANPDCAGKLLNRIDYYCSKKGLDIKGLSKATIEKLISWGWIENFADLYLLKEHRKEWIQKSGWGEASVDKILESIEVSKETTLDRFISGIGIPQIGPTIAKAIVQKIDTYELFRTVKSFTSIDGISYSKQESLANYDYSWADEAVKYLHFTRAPLTIVLSSINGKTFVITGRLNKFKNREELVDRIVSYGGKVVNSISSKTDYLINNDVNSKSAKNLAAKALNIPIISEEEFLNLTNNK